MFIKSSVFLTVTFVNTFNDLVSLSIFSFYDLQQRLILFIYDVLTIDSPCPAVRV